MSTGKLLHVREIQIKTYMSLHFTLIRKQVKTRLITPNIDMSVEQVELSYIANWSTKWENHFG